MAVSGGVDSVALLNLLLQKASYELIVAHVDHGWRNSSADDALFVQKLAESHGLLYQQARLDPIPKTENFARIMRYEFLFQVAAKHQAALVTAHHKDDVYETSIMNLMAGSGVPGIATPLSDPRITRPFLGCSKKDIMNYARHNKLAFVTDSSNQDTSYLRNHIRLEVISKLLKQNPGFLDDYDKFMVRLEAESVEDTLELSSPHKVAISGPHVKSMSLRQLSSALYRACWLLGEPLRDEKPLYNAALKIKTGRMRQKITLSNRLKIKTHSGTVVVTREGA